MAQSVLGVSSLIIWALIVIISLKYAVLILRADNRGEGGIVALLAILRARHARGRSWRSAALVIGLVGAALLYGDGAITPAISVLSAVEGLKVDAPALAPLVLPFTLIVLIALFPCSVGEPASLAGSSVPSCSPGSSPSQSWGCAALCLRLKSSPLSIPCYALKFLLHAPPLVGFAVLGATFLAVTGGEALYADMGHFGRAPSASRGSAWFCPASSQLSRARSAAAGRTASAGQSILSARAGLVSLRPLVAFATIATVIASQAIISGAFSLTQQAIQLGFLPRFHVLHTALT